MNFFNQNVVHTCGNSCFVRMCQLILGLYLARSEGSLLQRNQIAEVLIKEKWFIIEVENRAFQGSPGDSRNLRANLCPENDLVL